MLLYLDDLAGPHLAVEQNCRLGAESTQVHGCYLLEEVLAFVRLTPTHLLPRLSSRRSNHSDAFSLQILD